MKRTFISGLLICMALQFSIAAEWTAITSAKAVEAGKILISSTLEKSEIQFIVEGFHAISVKTPQGPKKIIRLPEATQILEQGAPDLPKLTTSVIIPDMANMDIKVTGGQYRDFENIDIAPSKGNLTRDIDPETVAFVYGDVYQKDEFFPGKLAELRDPYIIRDYRGQTAVVYPFQYNPVTKTLRVYYEMTIEVFQADNNGINTLNRKSIFSSEGFQEKTLLTLKPRFKELLNTSKIQTLQPTGSQKPSV